MSFQQTYYRCCSSKLIVDMQIQIYVDAFVFFVVYLFISKQSLSTSYRVLESIAHSISRQFCFSTYEAIVCLASCPKRILDLMSLSFLCITISRVVLATITSRSEKRVRQRQQYVWDTRRLSIPNEQLVLCDKTRVVFKCHDSRLDKLRPLVTLRVFAPQSRIYYE